MNELMQEKYNPIWEIGVVAAIFISNQSNTIM